MDRRVPSGSPRSALVVDLYELTMMQAYLKHDIKGRGTFDLFVRRLPKERNFLLTAGLGPLLERIESVRFQPDDLEYLESTGVFSAGFLDFLEGFQFSGDVDAMPEGTVAFAGEPIMRVTAPIAEAQFLETLIMNQLHVATLIASKAARVVLVADGKSLVDFGLRRMHGIDAGIAGARACWIAGFDGSSNVLAGSLFGIPVMGTMAHSFVQCHERERLAFERFLDTFPETVLLVDTYDTIKGVDIVIDLARSLGDKFRARGVRLDSGDIAALAVETRRRLDQAGLEHLQIVASGNLDEWRVRELASRQIPIDALGVGTRLGTSEDAPNLDMVYKIAQFEGRPVLKLSSDKATLPGMKQVWRQVDDLRSPVQDLVGLVEEPQLGTPLLVAVMRDGRRLDAGRERLDEVRARAAAELARLPDSLRGLTEARPPYPVTISEALQTCRTRVVDQLSLGAS